MEQVERIKLTNAAISEIKDAVLLADQGPDAGLRIAVIGGGCSGLSYVLDVVPGAGTIDNVFEFDGVKVYVDPKSMEILEGITVDYVTSLTKSGFKFTNPNAERMCGCGLSFNL